MNRRLALLLTAAAALSIARTASAQGQGQGEVTIGYQGLPYKSSGETATGVQVSDGVLLHVGAGAEAGYDSNVFYQEKGQEIGSSIYRTSLFEDVSNASRTGGARQLAHDLRRALAS